MSVPVDRTCGARIFFRRQDKFKRWDVETCGAAARWYCNQTELMYCDKHMHAGVPGCCHLPKTDNRKAAGENRTWQRARRERR